MTQTNNTFDTIYEVDKFTTRINKGRDYEIVRNGVDVVETLKWDQYNEDEVAAYADKCEYAHKVINDIKASIDMIRLFNGSYHIFKNAVETLEQLDVPNYMSDDVIDLERKLIRMMVWLSTPLTTTESREISDTIYSMAVKDFNKVRETINKIIAF